MSGFDLAAVNWPAVALLVKERGALPLLDVPPRARADLAAAAAAAGLQLVVIGPERVELRPPEEHRRPARPP